MRVVTLASGSQGTGKTFVAANLGAALARLGVRTCLVDLDLVTADLHLRTGCLGASHSLVDFLKGRVDTLERAMAPLRTDGTLQIIPGPRETMHSSSLRPDEIQLLADELCRLPVDVALVNLEVGVGPQVLDLFLAGHYQWVVATPEEGSLDEAARLLKLARLRRTARSSTGAGPKRPRIYTSLDDLVRDMNALRDTVPPRRAPLAVCPGLILNRCPASGDLRSPRLADGLLPTGHVLDDPPVMAEIPVDANVDLSCERLALLDELDPHSPAARAIAQLASSLARDLNNETLPVEEAAVIEEPALV